MKLWTLRNAVVRLAVCGIMLSVAAPTAAQSDGRRLVTESAEASTAIRGIIEAQLAAFKRDDGVEAFSYAAPDIQAQFRTPDQFMRMVRQGYEPVYRPRQVFFQELLRHQDRWVQPLLVTAQDGRVVIALYTMIQLPDESWRIGGVVLLPAKAQGA